MPFWQYGRPPKRHVQDNQLLNHSDTSFILPHRQLPSALHHSFDKDVGNSSAFLLRKRTPTPWPADGLLQSCSSSIELSQHQLHPSVNSPSREATKRARTVDRHRNRLVFHPDIASTPTACSYRARDLPQIYVIMLSQPSQCKEKPLTATARIEEVYRQRNRFTYMFVIHASSDIETDIFP